jgi:tetratricopeptide (TPR) repeat protein
MISGEAAGFDNTISGGIQLGPVLQGRNVQAAIYLPAAAPVALAQLPASVTVFSGRDGELQELASLLDPGQPGGAVVVSAVAGLAGVGKTALAVQAGHSAHEQGWFPGGTLFIDLHGYDDQPVQPAQALDALLRALGVRPEHIPPTAEERAGMYRSVLAQISDAVLVIADNASAEAQVRPLMPGAGPHKILVTSRHILAGLDGRLVDLTILDDDASIALLDAALRAARPGDKRIAGEHQTARRIAETCRGLPLALQITASILKADLALSTGELAAELAVESERLERLAYDDGSGTGASSVVAAFRLSYRRLDDAHARLFRFLSVNPGPDMSTATAAVLADLPVADTRRLLAGLSRAHLAEAAPGSAGRWQMHDLLRLYAQRLSDEHAAEDCQEEARDRLLGYYLDMAAAADAHLRVLPRVATPSQFSTREDALAWLDAERPNLTAVVTLAAATGRNQVTMNLPVRLAGYFDWRRRFDDCLAMTAVSRDAARRLGARVNEAAAVNILGGALRQVRQFEQAIAACQDAVAIFRETGDRHGEAIALNNLGAALREVRRFEEAIVARENAVAIFRETGDRHGEAIALNNLGAALRKLRRLEQAIIAHQEAAAIFSEIADRHGEGLALNGLGAALRKVPRLEQAIMAHQEAAAILRETNDQHGEADALDDLGVALRELRRFEEAIIAHQDAGALYRETGDRHGYGDTQKNIGIALIELQRFEEAISACQDATGLYRETDDRHSEGITLTNLGAALSGLRRFEEAILALEAAVTVFRGVRDAHNAQIASNSLKAAMAARKT